MGSNVLPGRPFTDVLGECENGELHQDLTKAVYDIMHAVCETRKKGNITLSIDFVPAGRGNTVTLATSVKKKIPEHDRPASTFFIGKDMSLHRSDPNQEQFPFRDVTSAHDAQAPIDIGESDNTVVDIHSQNGTEKE